MKNRFRFNFSLAISMLGVAQCNNTQLPLKLRFINVACVAEKLQELKEKEKEAEYFTKMPSKHYMEISSLLLSRSIINVVKYNLT